MIAGKNIGIIGKGIVGNAVEYGFKKFCDIKYYDKFQESDTLESVVKFAEHIFVCLPTLYKDNKIDLSIIDENMEEISYYAKSTDKIITIKSTVVPGTTRNYSKKYPDCNFCFNPEFLTEANYLEDFVNTDRVVVGSDNDRVRIRVMDLYRMHGFSKTPIFGTDLTTAEMVKYMANCFLSTKVIFANEMYALCEKLGIKYEEVKKMVVADKRIHDSHLDVTTSKGYGGKCFYKDMVALMGLYKDLDLDYSLLKSVHEKNLKIRKNHDWEEIPFVSGDMEKK